MTRMIPMIGTIKFNFKSEKAATTQKKTTGKNKIISESNVAIILLVFFILLPCSLPCELYAAQAASPKYLS